MENKARNRTDAQLSWLNIVALIVCCLAIAVVICTWYPKPNPKPADSVKSDTENLSLHELQELKQELTQSLSRVESEMNSSILKLEIDFRGMKENMHKLEIIVSENHKEEMKEKENFKDMIKVTKKKHLEKIYEKTHVLHRRVQEEFHSLKYQVNNKLNSIAKILEDQRQFHIDKQNFKKESRKKLHNVKMRLHISQENMDLSSVNGPFQMMDEGNDFLDKCEDPNLNQTKNERKGSIYIKGYAKNKKFRNAHDQEDTVKLMVQEHLGDSIKAAEKKLVSEISEKREMMHKRIHEEFNIMKDGLVNKFDNIENLLNNERCMDAVNWKEDLRKQSEDVANQSAQMTMQISEMKTTLRVLNDSIESHGKSAKSLAENIAIVSTGILALHKRMEYIEENTFDKSALVVVIMFDNTILLLLVVYLCAFRGTNRNINNIADIRQEQVMGGTRTSPASYSTATRILSQVQTRSHLERKLCVISFYEETHPLHMRIIQSVIRQLNLEPVEFIIRKHEAILEIPPASLYFLCVDFNERNVILEDPSVGLGDLRLTTVQAIQKMGGKLVILYVKDPKSKKLDPGKLYNGDLLSVTRQRELSSLNQISRFISAYDSLSEHQIMHLRTIISDELHRHWQ